MKEKFATVATHLGRDTDKSGRMVNIPPYRGSTVLFEDASDVLESYNKVLRGEDVLTYGTSGAHTHQAFYEVMNALEGGVGTWAYATGLAGCVIPFFAFAKAGDHVLVTDSVYGPTREFCENVLSNLGVQVEFYDPLIGADIEKLFKSNTTLVFMESPGTHSFEMQDVPAIAAACQKRGIYSMIDNTWATPLYFNPLKVGVDVVIHAITKYIGGHSDLLGATATCNERSWPKVKYVSYTMGQLVGADDMYLALRGLRTLKPRVEYAANSARKVIGWLKEQPEVARIYWPADPDDPGHEIWKRDFTGATSLFAFEFKPEVSEEQIMNFMNSLKLFGHGFSWGGYESLILRSYGKRTATQQKDFSRMIRISIGMEDSGDLIDDLAQGFTHLR